MIWNLFTKSVITATSLNSVYLRTLNEIGLALGEKWKTFKKKPDSKKIFVIDFSGDLMASQAKGLTQEVSAILCSAKEGDSVLVRLQSPGGAAHAYGYAASQLKRFKKHGMELTVAVDQIAASGGYMMSCVADKIIAAPFAIIGSIGVVAEFPNFNSFLENLGIDYRSYTAGRFKRTVTPMGKITEEGEQKFKEDLQTMYDLFRDHVKSHRPQLDMDVVATGEHWSAINAIKLGLVDEIKTSEDYIIENLTKAEIIKIQYVGDKKHWSEKFAYGFASVFFDKVLAFLTNVNFK